MMFDGQGILRGLKGALLPCGCLVGVYERFGGEVVAMIDAVGESCLEETHVQGAFVSLDVVKEAEQPSDPPFQTKAADDPSAS